MKDYKEKLELARDWYNDQSTTKKEKVLLENLFPELKESEDERIRKELKSFFDSEISDYGNVEWRKGIRYGEIVAWLEKQGEKIDVIENFNTEFERQISHLIASIINKEHEYNEGFVKWTANALLNYAKHEFEKQSESCYPYQPGWRKNYSDNKPKVKHSVLMLTTHGIAEGEWLGEEWCQYRWSCKVKDTEVLYWMHLSDLENLEKENEKQGEQKPADKVEPKFKVGDWILIDNPCKIISIEGNYIVQYCDDEETREISKKFCEFQFHLWTIQDAKDGDIIANGDMVLIFKCLEEPSYRQHIIAHIGLDINGNIQVTNESWNLGLDWAKPATKEQRDLLFSKMKEAGYEWDAEKKELKKIEQKPDIQHSTEWSVSDFRTWQYIVSDVLTKKDGIGQYLDSGECQKIAKYMQEEWEGKLSKEQTQEELRKGEYYGIDGLYHAARILEKTLGEVEGYQSDDGILEHKCAIEAVNRLYKQKPAWSEEDDYILNLVSKFTSKGYKSHPKIPSLEFVQDWLKSLKERMKGE